MIIRHFVNEIGNKIKIKIKNEKDVGVNYKTKEKIPFTGVSIAMFGPTSVSENVVTPQEAEELYLALHKFFNK
jgi:hypothetical protein